MWNDKVEATPKLRPGWVVPLFFVALAVVGAAMLVVR